MFKIIAICMFTVFIAPVVFALEDMNSLIETSCELIIFSEMRREDNNRHIYPPKWLDDKYRTRRVAKCVREFKNEQD
jgi:hypothetical protein